MRKYHMRKDDNKIEHLFFMSTDKDGNEIELPAICPHMTTTTVIPMKKHADITMPGQSDIALNPVNCPVTCNGSCPLFRYDETKKTLFLCSTMIHHENVEVK